MASTAATCSRHRQRPARPSLPGKPDPLSVSAYYLSATRPGPGRGRRAGAARGRHASPPPRPTCARAATRGSPCWRRTATSTATPTTCRTTAEPFDLPPRRAVRAQHAGAAGACARSRRSWAASRCSSTPTHVGWAVGEPNDSGVLSAWFRLEDGREPDPLSLLLVVDALPPVMFTYGRLGWAPTLELTAHVRAKPAPGWLRGAPRDPQHRGRHVRGGLRGLGLRRPARRPVAPARAPAPVALGRLSRSGCAASSRPSAPTGAR